MRKFGGFLGAALALMLAVAPALAWKPRTHVYLAEQAMQDALDDGRVTLHRIDPTTGRLQLDSAGNPVVLGEFEVRPEVLEALRKHPAQFRAGVMGPDAFPDIATGQTIIHPAGKVTPGESGVDLNPGGPGTNPWLEHLWSRAFAGGRRDGTPANRAFVVGFLTHAAGDLYAHTMVNHYTGDAFHFRPEPMNAVRHIVLEGYVDSLMPPPTFQSRIDQGVDDFIHRHLVNARPGTEVARLMVGENTLMSLPAYFCSLRQKLEASLPGSRAPVAAYKRAWIKDIDRGLVAFPDFSHRLAQALFFNPEGKTQVSKARDIVDDFAKRHLLSMAGLPDAVGASARIFERIIDALGLTTLKELIAELKKDAFTYLVKRATGLDPAELKRLMENSGTQFDLTLDREPLPGGQRINRNRFDEQELGLPPGGRRIDFRAMPSAYNTVVLTKLLFLGKDEVNRLMGLLGSRERLEEDNILLGYIETLDGSRQWKANPRKMVLARDEAIYNAVFMRQSGDTAPAARE